MPTSHRHGGFYFVFCVFRKSATFSQTMSSTTESTFKNELEDCLQIANQLIEAPSTGSKVFAVQQLQELNSFLQMKQQQACIAVGYMYDTVPVTLTLSKNDF